MTIRQSIIVARDKRGWSTNQLAKASGVPQPRLNHWLKHEDTYITTKHLEPLLKALGLKVR